MRSPRDWEPLVARSFHGQLGYESTCRHERIQSRGVEGQLLSGEDLSEEDAGVLRSAVLDSRSQLHFSPTAVSESRGELGAAGAGFLSVCIEGSAAHFARQAVAECREGDG